MNTTATTYIRYSEPTVRSNVSQAYSQCLPEPDYGYSPAADYASYYNEYAPMPQQPMRQAPVAKSSSSGKGLVRRRAGRRRRRRVRRCDASQLERRAADPDGIHHHPRHRHHRVHDRQSALGG